MISFSATAQVSVFDNDTVVFAKLETNWYECPEHIPNKTGCHEIEMLGVIDTMGFSCDTIQGYWLIHKDGGINYWLHRDGYGVDYVSYVLNVPPEEKERVKFKLSGQECYYNNPILFKSCVKNNYAYYTIINDSNETHLGTKNYVQAVLEKNHPIKLEGTSPFLGGIIINYSDTGNIAYLSDTNIYFQNKQIPCYAFHVNNYNKFPWFDSSDCFYYVEKASLIPILMIGNEYRASDINNSKSETKLSRKYQVFPTGMFQQQRK